MDCPEWASQLCEETAATAGDLLDSKESSLQIPAIAGFKRLAGHRGFAESLSSQHPLM